MKKHDIVIIGAGITGASIAMELSRFDADILWLEKENDVAVGTTRANSAILHAGYDPLPGSLMAATNVAGNKKSFELCEKLGVEHNRCGSLVLAFNEDDVKMLEVLYDRGIKNGVPDLQIISRDEVLQREPNVSGDVIKALYAPTAGVVNPWGFCLALAETAVENGVNLQLSSKVTSIRKKEDGTFVIDVEKNVYDLETGKYSTTSENIESVCVINCAGVHSADIHSMVAEPSFKITPVKGEYYLFDRSLKDFVHEVLFQCPSPAGKGVLLAPTMHGNLIAGPNAEVSDDPDDTSTTSDGLAFVRQKVIKTAPALDFRLNIRNFAGMRSNIDRKDFVVEWAVPGFLDVAGIQSPGLTSAVSIADMVLNMVDDEGYLPFKLKNVWNIRRRSPAFSHLSAEEKIAKISQNSKFGRVICRCETITEGEILEALQGSIPPRTLDGIKRRCGSGLGRCQGGFCAPRIVDIIAKYYHVSPLSIENDLAGSHILIEETKVGAEK